MERDSSFDHQAFEETLGAILHHIDYEDVSISSHAAELISKAAKAVMQQAMPGADSGKLTVSQAVALFVDHVFWEEATGGLVMCMDVAQRSYCLPIPPEHWSLKEQARVLQ